MDEREKGRGGRNRGRNTARLYRAVKHDEISLNRSLWPCAGKRKNDAERIHVNRKFIELRAKVINVFHRGSSCGLWSTIGTMCRRRDVTKLELPCERRCERG